MCNSWRPKLSSSRRFSLPAGPAETPAQAPAKQAPALRTVDAEAAPRERFSEQPDIRRGRPWEVFTTFLKLGLTSFGGPIAHLGYFHDELVTRRKWIDEEGFANLVALAQFLPGPASSQVGFALGLMRGGGLLGGLAAFAAFTLPSAALLFLLAASAAAFDGPLSNGVLRGLNLVAVAVVAQAVHGMALSLAQGRRRAGIALAALGLVTFFGGGLAQIGAIGAGALAGAALCREAGAALPGPLTFPVRRRQGAAALCVFAALFLSAVFAPADAPHAVAVFAAFYSAGALVFGGGHVVLPLLQTAVVNPGWVSPADFLAGYGLAQAVPGPLFAFAAYLGALLQPGPNGLAGAALALAAIFFPGLLLVYGALPYWSAIRAIPLAQAAMRGANAAVVGILGAALYSPVFTSAVLTPRDFALALAGFLALTVWKAPPWIVVVMLGAAGAGQALLGTS